MALVDVGYRTLRPALFRLGSGDAEGAHTRTLRVLAAAARRPVMRSALRSLLAVDRSPRRIFGTTFPGAVGLAAGMDKDGVALEAWPAMGFGFIEVGTVTAVAQPGNDRPRLFRLPASGAIVNRMGFNNAGAAALAARLAALGPLPTPLGISLGKSKAVPVADAVEDYLTSLRLLAPYADYLAVNVSSPNTPGLRSLQDREPLAELLDAVVAESRTAASQPVPVLVKVAPDLTDSALGDVLQVCSDAGVAGVIATNTTLSRAGVARSDADAAAEAGGLSGAPLAPRAREVVRFLTSHSALPVVGVGGILNAADGLALLDAGASLLQVYTGLVYAGPGLVRGLNQALLARETGGITVIGPSEAGRAESAAPEIRPESQETSWESGHFLGSDERKPFGARLAGAMRARGPLCVGIDPHPQLLQAWDLPSTAAGVERFARTVVEALGDRVAVIKPQSAFFEVYGRDGIGALEGTLGAIREAGALVLLDVKRGDIGSTMSAYAHAYLADDAALVADAITVSPYLGFGSLQPAFDLALQTGRGVFVLALTSNPEGAQVQHAADGSGRLVAQQIADAAAHLNGDADPMGSVGLVVGATVGRSGVDLSRVNGPLLAPGIGAQGATADDLGTVFGADLTRVLPSSSREILRAGSSLAALRAAADRTLDQVRRVLSS